LAVSWNPVFHLNFSWSGDGVPYDKLFTKVGGGLRPPWGVEGDAVLPYEWVKIIGWSYVFGNWSLTGYKCEHSMLLDRTLREI
jgi:hypothetical protein